MPGEKLEKFRERFFLEAQSAGSLLHPNIVAVYDAGLYKDFCYITMEYVDGPSGRELLDRFNRCSRLGAAVAVVERVVVAGAVQRVVRILRGLSVDADGVGAERVGRDAGGDAGQHLYVRLGFGIETLLL